MCDLSAPRAWADGSVRCFEGEERRRKRWARSHNASHRCISTCLKNDLNLGTCCRCTETFTFTFTVNSRLYRSPRGKCHRARTS